MTRHRRGDQRDGTEMERTRQHTQKRQVNVGDPREPTVRIPPQEGRRSINVPYLISGFERRASIAHFLLALCETEGVCMNFFDVDIHVGGSAHDLLDAKNQEDYIARILAGKFDVIIFSPPCGSWSRAS